MPVNEKIDRLRLWVSNLYFDVAAKLPKSRIQSIQSLQIEGPFRDKTPTWCSKMNEVPDTLQIEFLSLRLIELFSVEEFEKLRSGMTNLFPSMEKTNRNEFFYSNFSPKGAPLFNAASWQRVGKIGRTKTQAFSLFDNYRGIEELPSCVETIDVQVLHCLPSTVAVTFDVLLNEEATRSMHVKQSAHYRSEITLRTLIPWKVWSGSSTVDASNVQRREMEKFFRDLRAQIERYIKKYLCGHFLGSDNSVSPSLPVIEVFSIKNAEGKQKDWSDEMRWLQSFGFERVWGGYGNEVCKFFPSSRNSRGGLNSAPRVLINWETFLEAIPKIGHDVDSKDTDYLRRVVIHECEELLRGLTLQIGLETYLQSVQRKIEYLRLFVLEKKSWWTSSLDREMDLFERVLESALSLDRFALELTQEKWSAKRTMHALKPLRYSFAKKNKDHLLNHALSGLKWTTTRLQNHAGQLRSAYSELVDLRNLRVNYRLQRRVMLLTVIATLAALVGLIAVWDTLKRFLGL